MKKWYLPHHSILIAALAVGHFTGCAQTSKLASRWTGRDKDEQSLAMNEPAEETLAVTPKRKPSKTKSSTPSADEANQSSLADGRAGNNSTSRSDRGTPAQRKSGNPTGDAVASTTPRTPKSGTAGVPAGKGAKTTSDKGAAGEPAIEDPFLSLDLAGLDAAIRELPEEAADTTAPQANPKGTPGANRQVAGRGGAGDPSQRSVAQTSNTAPAFPDDPAFADNNAGSTTSRTRTGTNEAAPIRKVAHESALAPSDTADLPEWASIDEPESPPARKSKPEADLREAAARLRPGVAAQTARVTNAPVTNAISGPTGRAPLGATTGSLAKLCRGATGDVLTLVKNLDSRDVETVKQTVHRLGRMGQAGVAAAPGLEQLLSHEDGFVRVHAALALVRMQVETPQVLQTLTKALRSADPAVRSFAAATLAELGPRRSEAVDALAAALGDRDGYVRLHVAEVLMRYDTWAADAQRTLLLCLKDKDENVRWLAVYSLAELAPQSEDAVSMLTESLEDPVNKVRVGAAYALGEIGTPARSASSVLRVMTRDADAEARSAAEFALQQIEG